MKPSLLIEKKFQTMKLNCKATVFRIHPRTLDWDEYHNNREDYGVSGLIASQAKEISHDRIEEIDEGALLTEKKDHY